MPRVKTKPRPFRPLLIDDVDIEQDSCGIENTVKTSPSPPTTPKSTELLNSCNNTPAVPAIAIPLNTLVASTARFPTLQAVTVLAQTTANTRTPGNMTAPLVSAAIIPTLTPLGLTFPTISTLSIDLCPLIWSGTQPPVEIKQTMELNPPSVHQATTLNLPIKASSVELTSPGTRAGKKDRELTNCTVCGKIMRRGSIREHMDRHNNSGRFECPTCGKTFSRASAREKHVRIHTGEKPYRCNLCAKAYRQRVHLNEHMRSHTGNRPYICRLCGFALASKSLLNRHLRTHGVRQDELVKIRFKSYGGHGADANPSCTNIAAAETTITAASASSSIVQETLGDVSIELADAWRKHVCDQCPAGFPTLQALRSHRMITHGIVPSHPCPMCDQTFGSNKTRKQHLREKHPQFCPVCSKQMAQRRRWFLEAHIRDEHPEVSAVDVIGPSPLTNFWRKRFESRPGAQLVNTDGSEKTTGSQSVIIRGHAQPNSEEPTSSNHIAPDTIIT